MKTGDWLRGICIRVPGVLALAVVLLGGCKKEEVIKSRNFRMGFTPFPYEISAAGAEFVYSKLSTEADIINHHFDNGVPWPEALTGAPFDPGIMNDWSYRKSKTAPTHKTYVSVTPINFSRTGLAAYRGDHDNMPLPEPWNTYKFNDPQVKTAYLNYCERVIEYFKPDYFAMSIESNLLYLHKPELWSEYLELHEYVYARLKSQYPQMPVFCSVAGAPMLEGFLENTDHVQQRLAVMQLLELSDFYAISFYPYLTGYLGNPYPQNTFDELFSISPKPIIVAETGYTAETFTMNNGEGEVTIHTDPVKQQKFVEDLLSASEKWKVEFIIYFTLRDYDQLWTQLGSPTDLSIAWRDAGLYDEEGNARPALNSWRDYLHRKVETSR